MAVTIDTPVQINDLTWRITWSSSLGAGTTFYVYTNGTLTNTTVTTSMTILVTGDYFPNIQIFDSSSDTPASTANGFFTLAWTIPDGATQMIVEKQAPSTGAWSTVQTANVTVGQGLLFHTTAYLDDATGYIYAAKAVDAAGNASSRTIARFPMIRVPNVPVVAMTYSAVTGKVTITSDETIGDNTFSLYKGEDGPVSYAGAWESITSFPHVTAVLATDTITRLTVRQTNPWRLESANDNPTVFDIDSGGDEQTAVPSDPEDIQISAAAGGAVLVEAIYMAPLDGYEGPQDTGNAADTWAIWITSDGSTPDPADPETAAESMKLGPGWSKLEYTSTTYSDGATIKALVRARRSSDSRDSTNTAIVTTTADATAPSAPALSRANCGEGQGGEAVIGALYQDASNYVAVVNWDGEIYSPALRFYLSGNLVMQVDDFGVKIKGGLYEGGTAPGTAHTESIEYASGYWHFAAGSSLTRRWSVDANGDLSVPGGVVESASYPFNIDSLPDTYTTNYAVVANDLVLSPDLSAVAATFRDDDNKLYTYAIAEGAIN